LSLKPVADFENILSLFNHLISGLTNHATIKFDFIVVLVIDFFDLNTNQNQQDYEDDQRLSPKFH
jgi:hypothetical protein